MFWETASSLPAPLFATARSAFIGLSVLGFSAFTGFSIFADLSAFAGLSAFFGALDSFAILSLLVDHFVKPNTLALSFQENRKNGAFRRRSC
jgi:hypothetical protein